MQEDLTMTKDTFADKFGDQPRRDDLTYIAPKQDDPTEQVASSPHGFMAYRSAVLPAMRSQAATLLVALCADIHFLPRRRKSWREDLEGLPRQNEGQQCFQSHSGCAAEPHSVWKEHSCNISTQIHC